MGKVVGAERMLADFILLKTILKVLWVNKFLLGENVIYVGSKTLQRINVTCSNKLWPLCWKNTDSLTVHLWA